MRFHFSLPSFFSSPATWTFLLLLGLALAHLPFIEADADYDLSKSRGPWTDEGLYACQIKNLIQHHDTALDKSDGLIKTPLFGAILYGSYKVFGISLTVTRATVILLSLFLLFIIARTNTYVSGWIALSIPIAFLQYYVFHYSHLALTEILSSISILAGICFFYRALLDEKKRVFHNILSALFLAMSYFLKIQYAYIVVLVPVYLCIAILHTAFAKKKWDTIYTTLLAGHVAAQIALGLLYGLAWYLPNKVLYDHIMADQTTGRYTEWHELMKHLDFYYHQLFLHPAIQSFTCFFFLCLIIGFLLLFIKGTSRHFHLLFPLLIIWFMLELHKLPMKYLPSRYLVSTYLAMGSISALVVRESLYTFLEKKILGRLLVTICLLPGVIVFISNINVYKQTYRRREFSIATINQSLQDINLENRPMVGPWAPSLSWEVKGLSFPVWYNYFNDKDLIKKYHPKLIISELDEEDSGMAFKNHQLNIDSLAQEIRYYQAAKWKIKVVILK